MKPLVLLLLALLSASCFRPLPDGPPPRPPFRPVPPYGATGDFREPGTETGTFEPIPDGNRPPPPDANPRPLIDAEPTLPPEPQPIPRKEYPVAKPAAQPGHVISPYAPFNVIDVEGFKSGSLAKDPSNGKIFRVP